MERFLNKTQYDNSNNGQRINLTTRIEDNNIWFTFINGDVSSKINIPIPYEENSLKLLEYNGIVRALCDYKLEATQQRLGFLDLMYYVICDNASGIIAESAVKKTSFIDQIALSTRNDGFVRIISNLQSNNFSIYG